MIEVQHMNTEPEMVEIPAVFFIKVALISFEDGAQTRKNDTGNWISDWLYSR